MAKYDVTWKEITLCCATIEAESEQEAIDAVYSDGGTYDPDPSFLEVQDESVAATLSSD
jgi:hypothetical protein